MMRYNLWTLAAVLGFGAGPSIADAPIGLVGPAPNAPPIVPRDQRFLSRVARRTCEQYVADRSEYTSPYVPPSLAGIECRVIVTLRDKDRQLGIGSAGPGAVVPTSIKATLAAVRVAERKRGGFPSGSVSTILIEMEATGQEQLITHDCNWLQSDAIDRVLGTGSDGFAVSIGGFVRRVCPGELSLKNLPPSTALRHMLAGVGNASRDATVYRFRSVHWYQPAAGREVVTLRRGMTLFLPSDVTPASIDTALGSMAAYLMYRQQPSGLFAFEYEPAADAYSNANDPVHQAGAAWALAQYAARVDSEAYHQAAYLGIEAQSKRVCSLGGVDGAAYVSSPDGRNSLGLTAHVLLAMSSPTFKSRYADVRARLTAGILWLQEPSGAFVPAFPPARHPRSSEAYPGAVMLALLRQYRERPTQRTLTAFNSAAEFYARDLLKRPNLQAAASLMQPLAQMAVLSNRKELADIAYNMADWLIDRQLTKDNCEWPELRGGVKGAAAAVPDITTALCLAGWIDAIRTARRFGDAAREKSYEAAAHRAVRFVLQLQVREPETYYMRSVRDALGGVRTSPADNRLPIHNVQYALLALISYMDAFHKPQN